MKLPQIKIEQIKVTDLVPYSKNAKVHDNEQIKKLAASIKAFGYLVPIVIDKNNEIVAGHGRLEALRLLNVEEIGVIRAEALTEDQIKTFRLADNKLNESDWNMDLADEELAALPEELKLLTGFDLKQLPDNFKPLDNNPRLDVKNEKEVECPSCGESFYI